MRLSTKWQLLLRIVEVSVKRIWKIFQIVFLTSCRLIIKQLDYLLLISMCDRNLKLIILLLLTMLTLICINFYMPVMLLLVKIATWFLVKSPQNGERDQKYCKKQNLHVLY